MEQNFMNVVIIPEENRLTIDKASLYEISNATTYIIDNISSTFKTYLPANELLVNIKELPESDKKNINPESTYVENGETYIKLSSTADIARAEINKGLRPLVVYRPIQEIENTIYMERVDFNKLSKPIMEYKNIANL